MSEALPPIELSIVVPCLNEAETIEQVIVRAQAAMAQHGIAAEVIVADNGSTDASAAIASRCGARVVSVRERGYGAALLGGFAAARGTFIVMADADATYDLGEAPKFLAALRGGAEFVMGTRFPRAGGHIDPGAMPPLHRWLGTPVLTGITRLFFGAPISDVNCGMRGFRRDALARLDLRMIGMEIASEMVLKAAVLKLAIAEVPITLHVSGRSRQPHLRTWRDGWRHLRMLLLFSPRWLFATPGLALMLAGAIGMIALSGGSQQLGSVVFGANTLLVAGMSLTLGVQLLLLGVFAKVFVVREGLVPGSKLDRVGHWLTMEYGIVTGLGVAAVGIGLIAWAALIWRAAGFGPLAGKGAGSLVVLGVTAIVLGVQIASAGFFMGVLALHRRAAE